MIKISVIIPVYKKKEMFLSNLENNLQFLKGVEVIVVDDASLEGLDKDIALYKSVRYLRNQKNLGFARTVNKGIAVAKGKYIMLLNSDVRLVDDSYKKAFQYLETDKNLFAVSFTQRQDDGSLVGKNAIFFRQGMVRHKSALDLSLGPSGWAEGGAAMFRADYLSELGGLEELYSPFYWEDIDLSYRAQKMGWRVLFDPEIIVEHKHETTISSFYDKTTITTIAYRNQFIFIWLNITDKVLFIVHLLSLPYLFCYHLLKNDRPFFLGFAGAWKLRKEISTLRNKRIKKQVVSDGTILHKFHD